MASVRPLDFLDGAATAVARTAGRWARRRGHNGTSLPGLLAERIAPGITGRLASELDAIAVITGTNGKTTTTHLLDHILVSTGTDVVTNRSGANLSQSISTTLLEVASTAMVGRRRAAVLECDEFALADVVAEIQPNALILTNLFRDQLDRFAEIDEIERRWGALIAALVKTTIVAPADDPRLAWLATHAPGGCLLYGIRSTALSRSEVGLTHDSEDCPSCGSVLEYEWQTIGHLGSFRCPACGFARPKPWLDVEIVESRGFDGQTLQLTWPGAPNGAQLSLSLPGLGNAYNVAAAICSAREFGVDPQHAVGALSTATNTWGRFESVSVEGRRLILALGKNPASVAELIEIASASDIGGVMFVMNDNFQDGRDVSWYWDVNPATIVRGRSCAIAGTRALDFALRLKYERLGQQQQDRAELALTFDDPMGALRWLIDRTTAGATVVAIATYTGLLQLREALVARQIAQRMPV
jgi:UDP-N-acetylmuramyl tripeptide synthase